MYKLKMLVLAALVTATVVVAAPTAVSSASAATAIGNIPANCFLFGPPGHQVMICM